MNVIKLLMFLVFVFIFGCASYTTPGGSVQLNQLADSSINEILDKQPTASFPAHIVMARVQASDYRNHNISSFGTGRYSVVLTREIETGDQFQRLRKLPQVAGLGPLNKILLPTQLNSIKALREAAARLRADILLIYTFDTSFHVANRKLAPLNVLSLGLLKNKSIEVTTTASAAFYDVRTEYLYGIAEATSKTNRNANLWRKADKMDVMRRDTEHDAFEKLITEIEYTWQDIVAEYASQ